MIAKRIRSPQPAVLSRLAQIPREERANLRVLDVPAGNGVVAIPLAAAGFQVTGCDLFPEYVERNLAQFRSLGIERAIARSCKGAISRATKQGLFGNEHPTVPDRLNVVPGDMEERLPFADESFQIITCVEGIEHVDGQYRLIAEFRRLLQTGGRLILTTPNMLCARSRLSYALTGQRTLKSFIDEYTEIQDRSSDGKRIYHGHAFLVDYFQLRYYLHNNGFRITRLLPFPASFGNIISSALLLPLMLLAAGIGPRRARRKLERMVNEQVFPPGTRPPYREILSHVFSRPALLGSVILLEAEAI